VGWTRRGMAGLLGLATGLLGVLVVAPSAQAATGARVFVIHGIQGQDLDIVVDDKTVASGAKPKAIVGPLKLAPGSHSVAVKKGSSDVATSTFSVKSGQSLDLVAHRQADASMAPIFTVFDNNIRAVGPGKLRLTVAHVAAAPPADIKVDGNVLFNNVANGESLTLVVPAKTYRVEVVPAASQGDAILGPVDLDTKKGTLTRVFAVGNVAQKSMDAVVHVLDVQVSGAARPSLVASGDGGQAAQSFTDDGSPAVPVLVAGLAGGLAVGLLALAGMGHVAHRAARRRLVR
jgi:hypothetical protein